MNRAILHVDMDAFFASVEVRDAPSLRGKPVIVGGSASSRGVVAAASYEARRFGVHSAMATAKALRLCPWAIVLPPRHDRYAEVSRAIHAIFERFTPLVEPLSLDEAFLDVTGSVRLLGPPEEIGRAIKRAIRSELALVASVGIAPNKFLAKLASDIEKPDGFVEVHPAGIRDFLDPMPVTRLWGVGPKTAERLERLGIRTIGQLRGWPRPLLSRHLGSTGEHLWLLAHGEDNRPVVPLQEAKSISHETTFPRDVADPATLRIWISDLSEQVGWRLRREGLAGRTIQLKVRFSDFSTVTRARSLSAPTDVTATIRDVALSLYRERVEHPHAPVRLVGVGISGFGDPAPVQEVLFAEKNGKESRVDAVLDHIRERFGESSVRRGRSPSDLPGAGNVTTATVPCEEDRSRDD